MSASKDSAPQSEPYAAPAFCKHPSASSLPIPKLEGCSSSDASVSTQLPFKAWKPPPDPIAQMKQASSESDKSSSESQSPIKEDNEAQRERETGQNQTCENLDLQQSQRSNIDDTEQNSTEVSIREGPQEMIDIPADVDLLAQRKLQVKPHVAESVVVSERSTDDLLHLDYCKVSARDGARKQKISQQRLIEIDEAVEEDGANFVGEDVGEDVVEDEAEDNEDLASTEQVEAEIDRYESSHLEETYPSSLQFAKRLEEYLATIQQTAVDNGSKAEEGVAEESWEIEISIASQTFEDEGYYSMEE